MKRKSLLALAVFELSLGVFGATTAQSGMHQATLVGMAPEVLRGFRLGMAAGALLIVAGLGTLVYLWPKIQVKD